jgi:hypothetical protein
VLCGDSLLGKLPAVSCKQSSSWCVAFEVAGARVYMLLSQHGAGKRQHDQLCLLTLGSLVFIFSHGWTQFVCMLFWRSYVLALLFVGVSC